MKQVKNSCLKKQLMPCVNCGSMRRRCCCGMKNLMNCGSCRCKTLRTNCESCCRYESYVILRLNRGKHWKMNCCDPKNGMNLNETVRKYQQVQLQAL